MNEDRYCWFHDFSHPFDGVSDGWMCHAWGPVLDDKGLRVAPTALAEKGEA